MIEGLGDSKIRLMTSIVSTLMLLVTLCFDLGGTSDWYAAADGAPQLPRVYLNIDYVSPVGRTISVNAGGDFQAALNKAQPGDVISLRAGATFTGNFTLPAKTGTGWIIIRTSTPDGSLPVPGKRMTPQLANLLPKIVSPNSDGAIITAPRAHHYRLLGLEIGIAAGVSPNHGIVKLGDGSKAQNTSAVVPTDLIVDRCYIHGNPTGDVSRGVALNSASTAVIDSFISEIHAVGPDTQAICGWNGPGPFKIVNNYLEGAGENFMLGGADPSISGLIPSDIEFRLNHVYKPLRWRVSDPSYAGIHWTVKNLLELKNAQRLLIDGNVFENNWGDAQTGNAILLKSANQEGTAPWSVTRDVTFTNNVVRHSAAGINLQGRDPQNPSAQAERFLIRNNLWEDINGERWNGSGYFLQITETADVKVDHNTVIHTGNVITIYGVASPRFTYTNNLSAHNDYGVKGDGTSIGTGTISRYLPGAVFKKNLMAGGPSESYPPDNFFPATLDTVGFIDRTGGDYHLSSSSVYRAAGTDGQDIGYLK
jgi:hypothetical protein